MRKFEGRVTNEKVFFSLLFISSLLCWTFFVFATNFDWNAIQFTNKSELNDWTFSGEMCLVRFLFWFLSLFSWRIWQHAVPLSRIRKALNSQQGKISTTLTYCSFSSYFRGAFWFQFSYFWFVAVVVARYLFTIPSLVANSWILSPMKSRNLFIEFSVNSMTNWFVFYFILMFMRS